MELTAHRRFKGFQRFLFALLCALQLMPWCVREARAYMPPPPWTWQDYHARCAGITVPPTVQAGQDFPITVTLLNEGMHNWYAGAPIRLAIPDDFRPPPFRAPGSSSLLTRVELPTPVILSRRNSASWLDSTTATFTFWMRAPDVPGSFVTSWGMVWEGNFRFGEICSAVVNVTETRPDAICAGISVYHPVIAGRPFQARLTFRNTGTIPFEQRFPYAIGTLDDSAPFGINRAGLPVPHVPPGHDVTYVLNLTAPQQPGVHPLTFISLVEGRYRFGGPCSTGVEVFPAIDNALCQQPQAPVRVVKGETFSATVTFQNTGNTPWSQGFGYRAGAQAPQDNMIWGRNRIDLGNLIVAPGQWVAIPATFTAPLQIGAYPFFWGMLQEGVRWFGPICGVTIEVIEPPPLPTPTTPPAPRRPDGPGLGSPG